MLAVYSVHDFELGEIDHEDSSLYDVDKIQIGSLDFSIERGSTGEAGKLQLWDAASGKLLTTVPGKKEGGFSSSNDNAVRFVSDMGG